MPLNCTLTNGCIGKFYVIYFLPQFQKGLQKGVIKRFTNESVPISNKKTQLLITKQLLQKWNRGLLTLLFRVL